MLVNYARVDVGETNIEIIKFGQVVLMDCILELVLEALCHCLEGVVHLFCCFVADEEFALSLGRHINRNVISF